MGDRSLIYRLLDRRTFPSEERLLVLLALLGASNEKVEAFRRERGTYVAETQALSHARLQQGRATFFGSAENTASRNMSRSLTTLRRYQPSTPLQRFLVAAFQALVEQQESSVRTIAASEQIDVHRVFDGQYLPRGTTLSKIARLVAHLPREKIEKLLSDTNGVPSKALESFGFPGDQDLSSLVENALFDLREVS